jgi:hypothetical protein
MTYQSKLTQLAEQRSELDKAILSRDSMKWLQAKIEELRNPSTIPRGIAQEKFRNSKRFLLGRLYCFYYDPIGKSDLQYYDRFPMVLALEKYEDGFLGLNLHYLPYRYRLAFLGKLLNYAVLNDDNDVMKIRITYDILQASKRFKEFRPCIKRYLNSQIRSKILTIQPNEWEIASFLPIHQFKGAKAQEVWKDSVNEIKDANKTFGSIS